MLIAFYESDPEKKLALNERRQLLEHYLETVRPARSVLAENAYRVNAKAKAEVRQYLDTLAPEC